ncbi:response regulator [Aquibacillus sp. 3ASR75-11]|uniref:Response regulator n=1 Tax=Terrihalobacillus insolitus TaxID=2950438 RepID=A0A9X3WSZ7_9BACI|nr:response regulator [Terrihalobacillus insolitus]MDC3423286.1 response regulator [Terrihalobacillus insolitus]
MDSGVIKVLLIEDDPMVQEVNKQFIDKVNGFQVVEKASNGAEGLKKMREMHPDLVILDVYMPSKDGVEVLYQIRKEQLKVDVIAVTAASDNETIRTILQNGATDYIIKPFKFDRIKQALERYQDYRNKLTNQNTVSQEELDHLILKGNSVAVPHNNNQQELPKGLNKTTLQQINAYIHQQKNPLSAEEVAEGVGIARVTARRYLEFLKETGQIDLSIQYGGVGRPVNRYTTKK